MGQYNEIAENLAMNGSRILGSSSQFSLVWLGTYNLHFLLVTLACVPDRYGALDVAPLVRKERQKRQKKKANDSSETSKPKELTKFEEEEESTTKDVAHIWTHLKRACRERNRVHYFTFLVDPTSFAHTVENLFHFSFLVKVTWPVSVSYMYSTSQKSLHTY